MTNEQFIAAVKLYRQATLDLYDALQQYIPDADDAEEAARQLVQVVDAKSDLSMIQSELTALVIRLFGNRSEMVVDGRQIEKKIGSSRKTWQHRELCDSVLQRLKDLSIDDDTGEVTLTVEEAVEQIMRFAHIDYWRVTDLRELDVNADLYCTVTEGDPSVIVRKAK